MIEKKIEKVILFLFFLHLIDMVTTYLGIKYLGLKELNPISASCMNSFLQNPFFSILTIAKLISPLAFLGILYIVQKYYGQEKIKKVLYYNILFVTIGQFVVDLSNIVNMLFKIF